MVVLDDVENAKWNRRKIDLEAKTLNKVAANIYSFTLPVASLSEGEVG